MGQQSRGERRDRNPTGGSWKVLCILCSHAASHVTSIQRGPSTRDCQIPTSLRLENLLGCVWPGPSCLQKVVLFGAENIRSWRDQILPWAFIPRSLSMLCLTFDFFQLLLQHLSAFLHQTKEPQVSGISPMLCPCPYRKPCGLRIALGKQEGPVMTIRSVRSLPSTKAHEHLTRLSPKSQPLLSSQQLLYDPDGLGVVKMASLYFKDFWNKLDICAILAFLTGLTCR